MARTRKMLTIDAAVMRAVRAKTADGILTPSQVLELLLIGYADGSVTVAPQPQRPADHESVRCSLHQHIIDAALDDAGRRPRGGEASSLSGLCELLLEGYVSGAVSVTVAAAGHKEVLAPDQSAALRNYLKFVTGSSQEPLQVAPRPRYIPPGLVLPDGIPEDAAPDVQAALLSGLHVWLTGRLPPPSWSPDDILDSLEDLVRGYIPQDHFIGYAEDSGLDRRRPWGVWPQSH